MPTPGPGHGLRSDPLRLVLAPMTDASGPAEIRGPLPRSLVAVFLLIALGSIAYGALGLTGVLGPESPVPTGTPAGGATATATVAPTPTPTATPTPTPDPFAAIPVVPVADFRSTADSIGPEDVYPVITGTSPRWKAVELVADQVDAVLAALGSSRTAVGALLVEAPDAATLMADLAAHRDRLGFMRADEVGPGVTALGWRGISLFGIHREKTLDAWTLTARLAIVPTDAGGSSPAPVVPYDPATTATMFVAGDLGLDRTVAYQVTYQKMGVDYPYDGGTAKITGTTCCSSFGWKLPVIVSTGNPGAMRDLISSADLALANMEEPAADKFTFHPSGTVFTGDPALLAGVARVGFDVVGCATNHIGDAGRAGILQTVANLAKVGIRSFGCGKDLAAARTPAVFTLGGTRVAILAYDSIAPAYYGATATTIGSAPLAAASVKEDVAAARAAGAQVVIVYPHWGVEYTFGPSAYQKEMGHLMIDAGADMVIGNHPHWVQSVEVYKGRPIWYALGNFTFDQSWSEPTMESISLELTFRGGALVQARMHPHVLVKAVQPNLLDVATDGQRVLAPVYKASGALLTW
jgi:poly-gamma-glutamate capsule biosynthesis protein CapA/YwtB (metallophosphatase superfamily)